MKKILYEFISTTQRLLVVAIILFAVLCSVSFSYVSSDSMEPTIPTGSVLTAIPVKSESLAHDDIVLFLDKDPMITHPNFVSSCLDVHFRKNTQMLKRLVGLPGDVIEIRGGQLYRNGEALDFPDLATYLVDMEAYIVPDDCVFLLGDNRRHSLDSRFYGAVPINHVIGKVVGWSPSLDKSEQ